MKVLVFIFEIFSVIRYLQYSRHCMYFCWCKYFLLVYPKRTTYFSNLRTDDKWIKTSLQLCLFWEITSQCLFLKKAVICCFSSIEIFSYKYETLMFCYVSDVYFVNTPSYGKDVLPALKWNNTKNHCSNCIYLDCIFRYYFNVEFISPVRMIKTNYAKGNTEMKTEEIRTTKFWKMLIARRQFHIISYGHFHNSICIQTSIPVI
jgi:hypothetical protein